jgi:hypothetical protein
MPGSGGNMHSPQSLQITLSEATGPSRCSPQLPQITSYSLSKVITDRTVGAQGLPKRPLLGIRVDTMDLIVADHY